MKRISDKEIKNFAPDVDQDLRGAQTEWDIDGLLQAQLDSCEKEFNPDYLKFKDGVKAGRQLQRIADREEVKEIFEEVRQLLIDRLLVPCAGQGMSYYEHIADKFVQVLKQKHLGEQDEKQ